MSVEYEFSNLKDQFFVIMRMSKRGATLEVLRKNRPDRHTVSKKVVVVDSKERKR